MDPPVKPSKPTIRQGLSRNTKVQPLLKTQPTVKPTPARAASTPAPGLLDMSPDQLTMKNAPGLANGVKRGVGLGSGLRSEARALRSRSPTPLTTTVTTSKVTSRQGSVEPRAKKAGGKGRTEKEPTPVPPAQRRSARNAAAALKTVVEEKQNVVKKGKVTKKGPFSIDSDSEKDDSFDGSSSGSDLGFRKVRGEDKAMGKSAKATETALVAKVTVAPAKVTSAPAKIASAPAKVTAVPAKATAAPAKGTTALAKVTAAPVRVTRSSRSAAAAVAAAPVENDGRAQDDQEPKPVSVLPKWRERKVNEAQGPCRDSSSSGNSVNNQKSQRGSGNQEPVIVNAEECERDVERFRRKGPPVTYRPYGKKLKQVPDPKFQKIWSKSKPKKPKGTEESLFLPGDYSDEEPLFEDVKFIDPMSPVNMSTAPPQPRMKYEDADILPKVEFLNPLTEYSTAEDSPDQLANPKFGDEINEIIKATGPIAQVDLTGDTPLKKRKTNSGKYVSDSDISRRSSLTSTPSSKFFDSLDEPSTYSITSDPRICPICNDPFPVSFLRLDPNPSVAYDIRTQLDRCRKHKRYSAEKLCKEKNYPAMDIDWRSLNRRIDTHISHLTEILEQKRSSEYRDAAGQDLATVGRGKGKRKLMDTDWQSHTPGYYGPKGAHVMLTAIMKKMANRIREVGSNDRLIAGGGVSAFVQSVLVPELGVRLVMEDLKCGEEKARKVVRETVELGELVNDEDEFGGSGEEYLDDEEDGGNWVTL